uniref:Reverse transcriptase Ty1/copia-type domain-containing protein n=1 Tax=Lactuca sativa TaxID=4236 RepID=A0A9R1UKC6_LACSA|nr:hypothetical protein LSAT_V11C900473560 [Lactuca sativa]
MTLKETVNSMLSYFGLSEGFWGEAMLTAYYILNRTPNKRSKNTHYKLWYKKVPNLSYLKVWGSRVVVRLTEPKRKNLGEKGISCIFIGYVECSKSHRLYVIQSNSNVFVNTVIESKYVIFDEERFTSIPRPRDMIQKSSNKNSTQAKYVSGGTRDEIVSQHKYCYIVEEDPETFGEVIASTDVHSGKKQFMMRLILSCITILGQKEGIDLFHTYAPITGISIMRLLLDLEATNNLVIHQMDMRTAFLNGKLDEEIYTKQPVGFVMPGNENNVCKLKKPLYGLKQAPKQWHQKHDHVVLFNGFALNQAGKCVYSKFDTSGKGILILSFCLIRDLSVSQLEYIRSIGCLMYAMISTRPDISYVVGKLSRYTSNPSSHHWQALNRVFKYLKGTMDYGLTYNGFPSVLEGYSDDSWITNLEDHSSTSGWVFLFERDAISWASKKQSCNTNSTMKSEFLALVVVGKEVERLRDLIYEI